MTCAWKKLIKTIWMDEAPELARSLESTPSPEPGTRPHPHLERWQSRRRWQIQFNYDVSISRTRPLICVASPSNMSTHEYTHWMRFSIICKEECPGYLHGYTMFLSRNNLKISEQATGQSAIRMPATCYACFHLDGSSNLAPVILFWI